MRKHKDTRDAGAPAKTLEELERRNAALEAQLQEQDRNRTALLHLLEELERERNLIELGRRDWVTALDAVQDPIFIHDKDMKVIRANRAYAVRAGMDIRDVIGKPYWHVFPKQDGPLAGCLRAVEKERSSEDEVHLAGGETLVCRNYPIRGPDGEYLYSLHLLQDITEQRKAEAEQRLLSEALLQAAEAIIIADASAHIRYVNPAFSALFGYAPEEVVGQSVTFLTVPGAETPQPAQVERLAREGKNFRGETLRRARDGTPIPVQLAIAGIRNAAGEVEGFIGTMTDLRAVRQAAEAVRESEEKFRALVETTTDWVWQIDEHGVYTYTSPQVHDVLGYEPAEIIGKTPFDFMPPPEAERVRKAFRSIIAARRPFRLLENVNLRKDGRQVVLETSGTLLFDRTGAYKGCRGIDRDITRRVRASRALKTLSEGNAALVHAVDERALLAEMCRVITDTGGYRHAWIGYLDGDASAGLRTVAQAGFEPGMLESLSCPPLGGGAGQNPDTTAVREGMALVSRDAPRDPTLAAWRDTITRFGIGSVAVFPLMDHDNLFGLLTICTPERNGFDEDELTLLAELAEDLNFGILTLRARAANELLQQEHIRDAEHLKEALTATIRAVALTVEKRDPYTAGHQNRVADLCVAIGHELSLPEDRIEGLRLGATIHDIGKVYVPAEILNRPGKLSAAEFEIIKSHPQIGYDIVKDVKFPWPVAQMILQHHERLDGSGYPQRLKGEAIIPEARVLAVADTVEAMSSHRPYRSAHGIEAALAEIEQHRGDWYDPAVVDACLRLFREQRFSFDAKAQEK